MVNDSLTEASARVGIANFTSIIQSLQLLSSAKDSLYIRWDVDEYARQYVDSYKVSYQAIGSTVVQYSHRLPASETTYDITQLHENTYYSICVKVSVNLASVEQTQHCINVTTSIDSLSVALGSTFGAFLALGIIVFFVFIAKWQHNRKMQKQLQEVQPYGDSYEPVTQNDLHLEMSEVSLQVNEDTAHLDLSSQSSQFSNFTTGLTANGHSRSLNADTDVHIPMDQRSLLSPCQLATSAPQVTQNGLLPTLNAQDGAFNQDGRPPDVRPKDPAMLDFNSAYAHKPSADSPGTPPTMLRVNWSCNWWPWGHLLQSGPTCDLRSFTLQLVATYVQLIVNYYNQLWFKCN